MATYKIPANAAAADKYDITIREEGQVDSIQSVKTMLDGIGNAIPLKRDMATLVSNANRSRTVFLDPNYPNPSSEEQAQYGANPERQYVTDVHYHATPMWVRNAVHASRATAADRADSAAAADKLVPGAAINGHTFTGTENITLTAHDIDRVPKVYWGTADPNDYSGFADLRSGDLYVKVFN